jgi:hypothetical protein
MGRFAAVVLVCVHFVVVLASTVILLLSVVHCALSLTYALSLSYICSLSLSLGCFLSHTHTDALSLSRMLSLSYESSLSLYPLVCCCIHARRIFFFDVGWIDRAVVALRSFWPDLLVLLFVHVSGFVHNSFIDSNVL